MSERELSPEGKRFLESMFIRAYDRDVCGFGTGMEKNAELIRRMRDRFDAWNAAAVACERVFGIDLYLLTDTVETVKDRRGLCFEKRMELRDTGGDPSVLSECDKLEREFVELTHGLIRAQSNGHSQRLARYKELTAARAACMDTLGEAIEAAVTGDSWTVGGAASRIQSILNEMARIDIERANYLADLFSEVN